MKKAKAILELQIFMTYFKSYSLYKQKMHRVEIWKKQRTFRNDEAKTSMHKQRKLNPQLMHNDILTLSRLGLC
jgi:hypothetical protein